MSSSEDDEARAPHAPSVTQHLAAAARSVASGAAVGTLLGGAAGATYGYYFGQGVAAHAVTAAAYAGGAGAIYLPVAGAFNRQRGGTDPLHHMLAGTLSGYFAGGVYGGATALRMGAFAGCFGGGLAGVAALQLEAWRVRKGMAMRREEEERRRLRPLLELEGARNRGWLTEAEYREGRREVTERLRAQGVVDTRKPIWGEGFTTGGGPFMRVGGGGERSKDDGLYSEPKAAFFEWPEWWFWHKLTEEQVREKKIQSERMKLVRLKMEMMEKEEAMARRLGRG